MIPESDRPFLDEGKYLGDGIYATFDGSNLHLHQQFVTGEVREIAFGASTFGALVRHGLSKVWKP